MSLRINTIVIGISKDTVEKQIKFKRVMILNGFRSDVDINICSKFYVRVEKSTWKKYMGIERSTFLINTFQNIWNKVKVPMQKKF